jgi:hypothetical protein
MKDICDKDSKCFLKIRDGHTCKRKETITLKEPKTIWYCLKELRAGYPSYVWR